MSAYKFITSSKYIAAATQILLTLAFSFIPLIFLASLSPEMTIVDTGQKIGFLGHFVSFFSSGELSLYILTVCGGITWLLLLNHKSYSGIINGVLLVAIVFVVLYVGMMLGRNLGFTANFESSKLFILALLYVTVLILWYVALVCEKPRKPIDEVQSANDLIYTATGEKQ